jgi:hypothetical protein
MRKILFATERVTGNSSETFYFIGVLVVFAVVAAAVVLHGGLGDEKRNKFRYVALVPFAMLRLRFKTVQ